MSEVLNLKMPNQTPDSGRWVRLYCEDWSLYQVIGKFVRYKPGSGKRSGRSRFMVYDPRSNQFAIDLNSWKDCEKWEYIDYQVPAEIKCRD